MTESGSKPTNTSRIYALDAWRAALLLLGIVLHSMSDLVAHLPETALKVVLIRVVDLIHTFRMPAFFVLSGYLGALLYDLRGHREFLKNRFLRIVVPFAIFAPLIGLLLGFLRVLDYYVQNYQDEPLSQALWLPIYFDPWWLMSLNHLWFLWHLILILIVFMCVWGVFKSHLEMSVLTAFIRRCAANPLAFGLLVGVLVVGYGFMFRWDSLPTDDGWLPSPDVLGFYLAAYFIGALIHLSRVDVEVFRKGWLASLAIGVIAVGFRYFDSKHGRVFPWSGNGMLFEGYVVAQAVACVFLTLGTLGVFLKLFSRPSPVWRYLSDSSYWVYLVHLPLMLHLPKLWARTDVPLEVYPILNLLGTLLVSYSTYACFVRSGFLGSLLNGHRYPSLLPGKWASLGASIGLMIAWGNGTRATHLEALEERRLGGALHCLPPNVSVPPFMESASASESDDCLPFGDHFVCLKLRHLHETTCEILGGTLYEPQGSAEDDALVRALLRGPTLDYWTAATDREEEGEWRTRDGRSLRLAAWAPGEPNDFLGGEDCVEISRHGKPGHYLNDVRCDSKNALICRFQGQQWHDTSDEYGFERYRVQPSAETVRRCEAGFRKARFDAHGRALGNLVRSGLEQLRVFRSPEGALIVGSSQGAFRSEENAGLKGNPRSLWKESSCALIVGSDGEIEIQCGDGRWSLRPE